MRRFTPLPASSASSAIRYPARAAGKSAPPPAPSWSGSAGFPGAAPGWSELFRGGSREVLEALALELLEHPGAIARRAEIQEDLAAIALFFELEACALARAREAAGYSPYPVPQRERDLLFVEARGALRAGT